jgi:WD40 repeat protein
MIPYLKGSYLFENEELVTVLYAKQDEIYALAELENGNILGVCADVYESYEQSLKIWDIKNGELIKTIDAQFGDRDPTPILVVLKDDKVALSDKYREQLEGVVRIYNLTTGELEKTLKPPSIERWDYEYVKTVLVTQLSNRNLAILVRPDSSNRGYVVIWSLESEHPLRMIECRRCECFLALPNDLLAAGINRDREGSIEIWNTNTGELVNKLLQNDDVVESPKYSSLVLLNETTMASHSVDSIIIWNLTTGERLRTFADSGTSMCLGSNSVLASLHDSEITFWNWQTGEIIQTLQTINKIISFTFLNKSNFILTRDRYDSFHNKHFCQVFVWRVKF